MGATAGEPDEGSALPAASCEVHPGSKLRRRGLRHTKAGAQQRWECIPAEAPAHYFFRPADRAPAPAPYRPAVHCPDAGHADAKLQSRGTRTNKAGTWQRYRCIRPNGAQHQFQVLLRPSNTTLTSIHLPPACPEHPGAHITRNGVNGKGARRRQRYRCVPDGQPELAHGFSPPLTREVVEVGHDECATCHELLGPHSGAAAGARHTPWTGPLFARALSELSMGASYASTAMMMRRYRDRARRHLLEAHGEDLADIRLGPGASGTGSSYVRREAASAWHLAADLVEQYSPLIWRSVKVRMEDRDRRLREINDQILAADPDAGLTQPLTWLLDEQPVVVWTRTAAGARVRRSWSVLVVVEVRWHAPVDQFSYPQREYRLRLMRAYPRPDENAWRLVFDEVGVRPDVIIADHAHAIGSAIDAHYGAGTVGFVPSMFHMRRNLRAALLKISAATTKVQGRTTLVAPLAKHLDHLHRDDLTSLTPSDWSTWWDDLEWHVGRLGVPIAGMAERRRLYEPRVAKAMPLLAAQPHLPASNAAVENQIRHLLEPFLTNRKQMYRNVARLNFLLDLAVARQQGAFTDLEDIAKLIHDDNEAAGGWAPQPRTLADTQPPRLSSATPASRYASLFNAHLVEALADDRLSSP